MRGGQRNGAGMITLRIKEIELFNLKNVEMFCLQKLKKSGIPVKGLFYFKGIDSGQLRFFVDQKTGDMVFIYREHQ